MFHFKQSDKAIVLFCEAVFFKFMNLASIDLGHFFIFYNTRWASNTKYHFASL